MHKFLFQNHQREIETHDQFAKQEARVALHHHKEREKQEENITETEQKENLKKQDHRKTILKNEGKFILGS